MENIFLNAEGLIKSIKKLIYEKDGVKYFENPQSILIDFENSTKVFIKCAKDGESLEFNNNTEQFIPLDMGEFGIHEVYIHEIGAYFNVKTIFEFVSNGKNIGVCFMSADNEINIFNIGDELFIYDKFPTAVFENEIIQIKRVR